MQSLNSVGSLRSARARVLGSWLLAAAACAENPSSPASTDHAALVPVTGAAGGETSGGAAGPGAAGALGKPLGPGPAIDGAALPDLSQAWSVAELLSHNELAAGEEVQVQGYATRVDLCIPCPAGTLCSECSAQVALGDRPDAGAGELVSVVGLFTTDEYDFAVGQRLAFRGKFKSRMASLRAAAAELRYLSYVTIESAP